MNIQFLRSRLLMTLGIIWGSSFLSLYAVGDEIDFSRDIRPILADTCYKCHGPDENERAADLRLDLYEDGIQNVVVPGKTDDSELLHRVLTDDPDSVMPPPESGRTLTAEQKELLRQWISEGARWKKHWSLIPPRKLEIPTVEHPTWQSAIDKFV